MLLNYLSLLVGLLYIGMGIFVIIRKTFAVPLETNTAYALSAVLIAYGVFRIVRAIYRLRKKDETTL